MKAVFKSTGGGKDPVKEHTASFSAGENIFHQDELGTDMYIIQEGEVRIIKKIAGESHILSHLDRGDFFGEMAILENVPRSADALAHTDVKAVVINGSRFDEMLRKTPEIAIRIIRKYSQRLREANDLLEKLVGHGVEMEKPLATLDAEAPPEAKVSADRRRRRLVDVTTGTAFFLSDGDETTIGRADPVTGILPDIDLTPVDTDRSVSRRHAKIVRRGDTWSALEEVGTVNGTSVNDERITTGTLVPLKDGDRLKIGLIQMKVVFE